MLSAGRPTQGQPQQLTFTSSDSDVHAEHDTSPFQKAAVILGELDHPASLLITRADQTPGPNDLPSLLPGINDKARCVPDEDDDSEGPTEHYMKLVAPGDSFEREFAQLQSERVADLEQQLSDTLAERDRHVVQLTDELALKSAQLEQAAEEMKRARLELRELHAELDESLLSRDHALEQAQRALQKASTAAEANEQSQRELKEMRAELEARKSESAAFRLRLADRENNCAKSKADTDTYRTATETGLVNTDENRVVHRLMERVRVMEAEMASRRWNEKSFEMMECRNEG
jgi:chromosome segregation ATPase